MHIRLHDCAICAVGLCDLINGLGGPNLWYGNYHGPECSKLCGRCVVMLSAFSETHEFS